MAMENLGLAFFLAAIFAGAAAEAPASFPGAMPVGARTSQPIGHFWFCKEFPAECARLPDTAGPARLDDSEWEAIRTINREVNAAVRPATDLELYGKDEVWSYPGEAGDCEDFALEKRRRIAQELGISYSNLLLTVVRRQNGEGHAVLTLRTTEGDFILDNLHKDVRHWEKASGYRFVKRQDSSHPRKWVSIGARGKGSYATSAAP